MLAAPPSSRAPSSLNTWLSRIGPPVLVGLFLLPFLGKAFHIDDPLFLWNAEQILRSPLDFYGSNVNWLGSTGPMAFQTMNPPLSSYLLAAVVALLGGGEVGIHAAFLIVSLACVVGMMALARELDTNPWLAALAASLTPVFLVSSTSLMSDVLMLALWIAAVLWWCRGIREPSDRSTSLLLSSGVFAALAILTKYYAISLVPLLLAHALFLRSQGRSLPRAWPWALALPLVALAGYEVLSNALYGAPLFSTAMVYSSAARASLTFAAPPLLTSLTFAGGCLPSAFLFAPLLFSRRTIAVGVAVGAMAAAVLVAVPTIALPKPSGGEPTAWLLAGQLALCALAGASLVALVVAEWMRSRDDATLLLALWVLGTFAFAGFLNWSNNGRSILPMAPAVGLLIARRVGSLQEARNMWQVAVPLAASAALALAVCAADASLANSAREAARELGQRYAPAEGRRLWLQGHWGFQYYLAEFGGQPLEQQNSTLRPGDTVVFPWNSSGLVPLPQSHLSLAETLDANGPRWLSTMNRSFGTGFYASHAGPLPFAFGRVPKERYSVYRVTREITLPLEARRDPQSRRRSGRWQ